MITIKKLTDVALIAFFVSAVWLPFADKFVRLDPTGPPNENRALTSFPKLRGGLELVDALPPQLESYFNDHFGFRNSLIKGHCLLKYYVFDDSGSDNVLIGKDGWLFYAAEECLESHRGVKPFTLEELEAWQLMLEARRDALAEMGIRYLFVFVPNKHTVYPEKLPDRFNVVNETSRLDQLVAHLRAHSDVAVLDLTETLIRGKKRNQTFERTGTHWTDFGMFLCQAVIIERLKPWFPNLSPLTQLDLRVSKAVKPGSGLSRMLAMKNELPEEVTNLRVAPPRSRRGEPSDDLRLLKSARGRAPDVFTGSDPSLPRLMLVGDSFGQGMTGMISHCFSRSVFVRHMFDPEAIRREKPDVVINEVVERFLMTRQPRDMRRVRNFHHETGD